MKRFIYLLIIIILCGNSFSQSKYSSLFKKNSTSDAGNSLILGSILVVTPTLLIEGGKSHFGLSKELSLGKFPYGRAEFDYTYVFRSERTSAVHLSYNLDIPFNGSFRQPSLFIFSPGGGYYTDFTRKGLFVQLAIGLWAGTGFSNAISVHPNLKIRKIFMQDSQPGIFEISLGVGFGIYTR